MCLLIDCEISLIPAFSTIYSIQITTYYINAFDGDGFVRLDSFVAPWTGFNVYSSRRTTITAAAIGFQYLAIGV